MSFAFDLFLIALPLSLGIVINLVVLAFLLLLSALASASEAAFFSLSPPQIEAIKKTVNPTNRTILDLLHRPNKVLATMLITNNMINIAIVLLSARTIAQLFDLSLHPVLSFFIEVVVITFLLLVIGEVTPKVYANQNNMAMAQFLAYPLYILDKIFSPLSHTLLSSVAVIEKRFQHSKYAVTVDELSHAIELTAPRGSSDPEQRMLKGIVSFGNTEVRQIMTPRQDVAAINATWTFSRVLETILSNGFSRIPVYSRNLDNITGILFIKDILPHIQKPDDFQWQQFLHPPYIVPETQKIDDVLKAFQKNRIHLAVVLDEYGCTSGLVTLEDIIEEILGEISDEFDDDQLVYSKLDSANYIFEGKTPLHEMCRITGLDYSKFEQANITSVTIGGFIVELYGSIPPGKSTVEFNNLLFKIELADNKRIELVKVTLN